MNFTPPEDLGPAGEQALDGLLSIIEDRNLSPGDRLGAEREIAETLRVSRSSLRTALARLELQGVVRRKGGRAGGVFVGRPKVSRDLSQIVGVPKLLRSQGFHAGTRTLSVSVRPAGPDSAALGVDSETYVVDLVRIRFANSIAMSLEQAVLPLDLVDGLPERDLSGSLYELLEREYELHAAHATERIEAMIAGPHEASILCITPGDALLSVHRTTSNAAGRVFESSHDLFRADLTQMVISSGNQTGRSIEGSLDERGPTRARIPLNK